jgi:hypothetical protein
MLPMPYLLHFHKNRLYHLKLIYALAGLLILWISGCATSSYRLHPDFKQKTQPIKVVYFMPPEVTVYEELPDGRLQIHESWIRETQVTLLRVVEQELSAKNYRIIHYPLPNLSTVDESKDIAELYRAVNKSIQLQTFGPDIFPDKVDNFVYSVGPIEDFLLQKNADAMVFVRGRDRVSPHRPRTHLSLALADANGTVIWYSASGEKGRGRLNEFELAKCLTQKVLKSLPEARP